MAERSAPGGELQRPAPAFALLENQLAALAALTGLLQGLPHGASCCQSAG